MTALIFCLVFLSVSVSLNLVVCEFTNHLTPLNVVISLVVGLVCAWCVSFRERSLGYKFKRPTDFDAVLIFCFLLFCYRIFLWIDFPKDGGWATLDVNNYGDLPGHIGYISNLARETKFWPESPIILNESFNYPFGVDFFSAMLLKLGAPLTSTLPLMGLACGLLLLPALYIWDAGFAIGSFLFSGGMAGYQIFATGLVKDYQADIAWKSLVLALWIPQRGFLYALPAALLLLWSWRRRFITGEKPLSWMLEGWIWGTMPIFHVHTFIFLSFIFAVWSLKVTADFWPHSASTRSGRAEGVSRAQQITKALAEPLKILAVAIVPATYFMIRLTDSFRRASVIWFKPGWMIEHQNIFMFFWNNFGLYVPLTLMALYFAVKYRDRKNLFIIVPALFFFIVCMFVMFAPWDWDNTKLMIWCYLMVLPAISDLIIDKTPQFLRVPLFVCLFFSGAISLWSVYQPANTGVIVAMREEVEGACGALQNLDHKYRFAAAQTHNHPVLLCGYQVVAGYAGTLWSQGQNVGDIQAKLRRLMLGDPGWRDLAKDLKARYLFWGPAELRDYPTSSRPWETTRAKIAEGSWGAIYDLGE